MRLYRCDLCDGQVHPHRKGSSIKGNIQTLYEIIKHSNGQTEKRIYGRVNIKTNEILQGSFLNLQGNFLKR